jgi:acyl-coenzyme A synthetase/AMP-(fatty) acid ligase
MEGVKRLDELVTEDSSGYNLPDIHEDDIAFMVQTSGSTGLPKLVVHTHKTVLQTRQSSARGLFESSVIQYNDRPFTWISGFPMNAAFGMKRVTINGFSPEPVDRLSAMVKIIQREGCTDYAALVPQIHALVKYQVCFL